MRKVKKIKKTVLESQTIDILCNMCGKSLCNQRRKGVEESELPSSLAEYSGLVETVVSGGYDSEAIGDMTSWRFSICEHCLKKLSKKFVIPVETKDDDSEKDFK